MPRLPYAPAELEIIERSIPAGGRSRFYRELGLDDVLFHADEKNRTAFFEPWADAAIAAGIRNVVLGAGTIEVRHYYDAKAAPGLVTWKHLAHADGRRLSPMGR